MRTRVLLTIMAGLVLATTSPAIAQDQKTWRVTDIGSWEWDVQNPAAQWAPRAGLQAVQLGKRLYVMGGRTPLDPAEVPVPGASIIWGDVWASDDLGESWNPKMLETAMQDTQGIGLGDWKTYARSDIDGGSIDR